jgi:rhodanese-related sulfurtransferase
MRPMRYVRLTNLLLQRRPNMTLPKDNKAIIIDVRTDAEHKSCCLSRAHHHIPLDQLNVDTVAASLALDKTTPIYFLCHAGKRAAQAADLFKQAGYMNACVIEGGIVACQSAGAPVTKGHGMSLERQVRICAGGLVVLGAVLASLVSPNFVWLSAAIGAGLVFAGVTDWCGMALLLAKAPWNRR